MACIRKFLDLSSFHLTEEEKDYLNTESTRSSWATPSIALSTRTQSGWLVYAYRHNDHALLDIYGVPGGLRRIMAHARALNCDYILFDVDAPVSFALPVYSRALETA